MKKRLQANSATHEEFLSELEIARIELKRREKLFKTKSISEQTFDENRYRVKGLEKRAASLKAEVERIEIELQTFDENRYRVKGLEKRAASLKAAVERIEI